VRGTSLGGRDGASRMGGLPRFRADAPADQNGKRRHGTPNHELARRLLQQLPELPQAVRFLERVLFDVDDGARSHGFWRRVHRRTVLERGQGCRVRAGGRRVLGIRLACRRRRWWAAQVVVRKELSGETRIAGITWMGTRHVVTPWVPENG
jgi:hypothetical protein